MDTSISSQAHQVKSQFEYTDWKEKAARIGHYAKGAVYGIAGVLTLLAAFNMGGQNAGKTQVIKFLEQQPFGQVLVVLMGLGLLCYAFYRFIQVSGKSESLQSESESKRKALKAGYLVSGLVYTAFSIYAFSQVIGSSSGGSGKGIMSTLLSSEWGTIIVYVAAGLLIIKAIYQFVKVANDDYFQDVRGLNIGVDKARNLIKRAGAFGLISRGILIAITAYFFFMAAEQHDPSEIKGSSGAFDFIQQSTTGPWLVGLDRKSVV